MNGVPLRRTPVSLREAREEAFFLGLRLNEGVDLDNIALRFGIDSPTRGVIAELLVDGLLSQTRKREFC